MMLAIGVSDADCGYMLANVRVRCELGSRPNPTRRMTDTWRYVGMQLPPLPNILMRHQLMANWPLLRGANRSRSTVLSSSGITAATAQGRAALPHVHAFTCRALAALSVTFGRRTPCGPSGAASAGVRGVSCLARRLPGRSEMPTCG